jgi:hypothetical protein
MDSRFRGNDDDVQTPLIGTLTNSLPSFSLRRMKPMRASAACILATLSAAASTYYYYGIARAGPE